MNQQERLAKAEALYSYKLRTNRIFFFNKILGLPLHAGQLQWVKRSNKKINILKPGNRWGKSLITAAKHIFECMTKQGLQGHITTEHDFFEAKYETLNFGPAYEQAREVLRLTVELVEGRVTLPKEYQEKWGKTNNSMLKGWAIANDRSESQMLPYVEFVNGARLLGRSYSDMGAAFKSKAIHYMSGDECADIAELWTFTNVTLLPRLVSTKGLLDFVGTVQSEGFDYLQMIDQAREDMEREDYEENGMFYLQEGSMYQNEFLDKKEIERTEQIADEDIRQQIIYGNYVETGDKYFGYERVNNSIDKTLEILPQGSANAEYITSADFAGGDSKWSDYTVIVTLDYTIEPYLMAYFWRIQGKDMPIPMQYEKVREVVENFPGRLILDASSLGGKNAMAFLRGLNPIGIDINARIKGEMLSTLKVALDGGQSEQFKRQTQELEDGTVIDKVQPWGLLRIIDHKDIVHELRNYKLDDKKIRNDIVMTLAQAVYYIEMRRPKLLKRQAVDFNLLA